MVEVLFGVVDGCDVVEVGGGKKCVVGGGGDGLCE